MSETDLDFEAIAEQEVKRQKRKKVPYTVRSSMTDLEARASQVVAAGAPNEGEVLEQKARETAAQPYTNPARSLEGLMTPPVGPIIVPEEIQGLFWDVEKADYSEFSADDIRLIKEATAQMHTLKPTDPPGTEGLTMAQKIELSNLRDARAQLQKAVAAWKNAETAYTKTHDKKEFTENMRKYQLFGERLFRGKGEDRTPNQILVKRLPGVTEGIDYIRRQRDFYSDKNSDARNKVLSDNLRAAVEVKTAGDELATLVAIAVAKKYLIAMGEHEQLGARRLPGVRDVGQEADENLVKGIGGALGELLDSFRKGI